jgi:argininosuccinate lyase
VDKDGYLGLGGRLGHGPGAEMVDAGFALEMADASMLHKGFALADLAHLGALVDAGCLEAGEAEPLLRVIGEMAAIPSGEFPYDPAHGDPWNSRERFLDERAGPVAGWLWVGRPRREAQRVALRIHLRWAVLDAHAAMASLAEAYARQAETHRDTPMSDFTYLQPAQPTTLGYILAGHLQVVLRHLDRLDRAYRWVNRSPAGAGGTTGASVPVDRARLAASLGFDGVIAHARDANWQTDGFVDLAATLAGAATEAGQVAADLEIWASPQFGFVELADEHSRVSALMPQKKNPYALSVVRQHAAGVAGAATGILSALRTPTARTDHYLFVPGELDRALSAFVRSTRLLAAVVRDARFDADRLASTATDPGLYLGDLADEMVVARVTDRRTAHRVLGAAARTARDAGRPVETADVDAAATAAGLTVPDELLDALGDAHSLLARRTVEGGWAHLGALLDEAGSQLATATTWNHDTAGALDRAEAALLATADPA